MAGGGGRGGRGSRIRVGKREPLPPPPPKRGAVKDAVKDAVNAMSDLVIKLLFNHHTGDYKEIIRAIRDMLLRFDPKKSVSITSEYFGVILSNDSSQVKKLIVFLRKIDAYLLAFYLKKLYEFGKEDAVPKPVPIFYESTFVGYNESYTDSMLDTLRIGYFPFRNGVDEMIDHPEEVPSREVLYKWRVHLVVIMVMLCEAARFHPVYDKNLELWNDKTDEKLPKGMILFMKNWSHMCGVARGELPDNKSQLPAKVDLRDEKQAKLLLNSKSGALSVIAFYHRGKKSQKDGEGTSRVVNSIYYQQRQEQYPILPERDMGEVRCRQSHPYPRVKGLLLERPPARVCDPEWKAIGSCWSAHPSERPSFYEISQKLRTMAAAITAK